MYRDSPRFRRTHAVSVASRKEIPDNLESVGADGTRAGSRIGLIIFGIDVFASRTDGPATPMPPREGSVSAPLPDKPDGGMACSDGTARTNACAYGPMPALVQHMNTPPGSDNVSIT